MANFYILRRLASQRVALFPILPESDVVKAKVATKTGKHALSYLFGRRKPFDQWEVDLDPVLTLTKSDKIGRTAITFTV